MVPDAILRPGPADWELWRFPQKGMPMCEENPSPQSLASCKKLLLGLPCRDVVALPLWLSAEGDAAELALLELTSRHLLKRTSAVQTLPIARHDARSLVLALATSDDAEAIARFPKARDFEISARLWNPSSADALVWRELDNLCFALVADGNVVFCSATGEPAPGPAFCGILQRAALRLKAEGIIPRLPATVQIIGAFDENERSSLAAALRADVRWLQDVPPPETPAEISNPAPPAARIAEQARSFRNRLAKLGLIAFAVYLLIAAVVGADLIIHRLQLESLRSQAAALAPAAEEARKSVTEWQEFRAAVDPTAFALDQLAAIARELPGDQVRLTQFSLENGRLLVTGEAADVSQAFALFEKVKSSPALQEYDWTSRQPQLAGRSKVRFEMEGARPDAKTDSE